MPENIIKKLKASGTLICIKSLKSGKAMNHQDTSTNSHYSNAQGLSYSTNNPNFDVFIKSQPYNYRLEKSSKKRPSSKLYIKDRLGKWFMFKKRSLGIYFRIFA